MKGQAIMGKRGPKKKDGKREANGQLSRKPVDKQVRDIAEVAAEEWETMATALMARWRVHHVPPTHLRDQKAGSYVGRLCIAHERSGDMAIGITRLQYDAAMAYLAQRHDYHVAIAAPKQMGAVDLNAVHGRTNGENEAKSIQSVQRYNAALEAVREKQNEIRGNGNLFAALDLCVCRDLELTHLIGDVRTALNALAKHYGLVSRKAA